MKPHELMPRATEAQCQATIVAAAKAAGWLVHAERPALVRGRYATPIQGHPGFPDLVLVHTRRRAVVFVELKRKPNRLEPAQLDWAAALAAAGADVQVWWVPDDLDQALAYLTGAHR